MSTTSSASSPKKPPNKKMIRSVVRRYLKSKAPSGYSLVVPDNAVMYVSDGVEKSHDRWYVQVMPEPEYVAETRRQEFLSILSDVQETIHKKHRWTVYLTSMLPVV